MNPTKRSRSFFLLLFIAYDLLFWKQEMGINTLLFHALFVGLLVYQEKRALRLRDSILLTALLLADIGVLYHASPMAKIMSWLGIIAWAGVYKYPQLALTWWSSLSFMEDLVRAPFKLSQSGEQGAEDRRGKRKWALIVVPLIAGSLFLILYTAADSTFSALVERIGDRIAEFFNWLPDLLSISHLVHILWSGLLVTALFGIWKRKPHHWLQGVFTWDRSRTKGKGQASGLKNEWQLALVTLLTLNVLTFLFNLNDMYRYWFQFNVPENFDLKQFVHGGTWITVSSIILSVLVILYIYRGNLLFWPGKPWLKYLSLAWIIQNGIMGISVFWRNYHYVSFHGFAFKRLGVFFFLACLLAGLIILWFLLERRKSTAWLSEQCTVYFILILSVLSIPDWNSIMLRYNLQHPDPAQIDARFYLSLSPHCLPELIRNKETVLKQINAHRDLGSRSWINYPPDVFEEELQTETLRFMNDYEDHYGWPSFSIKKYKAYQELVNGYRELENK